MPFWGDDKEKILELIKEIEHLYREIEYDEKPELWPQIEPKIHELINKLNKTSEKTFNTTKEMNDDDLGGVFRLSSAITSN